MKTQTNVAIRIGSKTKVEVHFEPFQLEFPAGTGHFQILVGDKKINCYAEPGALDNLNNGSKVRIPKFSATPNKK